MMGSTAISRVPRTARPIRVVGGALPVGWVLGWTIRIEVALVAALLLLSWQTDSPILAGGMVLVAAAMVIPLDHRSALGWLAAGIAFRLRPRANLTARRSHEVNVARDMRAPTTDLVNEPAERPEGASLSTVGLATSQRFAIRPREVSQGTTDPNRTLDATPGRRIAEFLSELIPGLTFATAVAHDGTPVGVACRGGMWTVVLTARSDQQIVVRVGETDTLPIDALVPLLGTAGIRLDSIQAVVITSPVSAALMGDSPALRSHLELLGGLPTAARRRVFVALRLCPLACAAAVQARGGGPIGAQRAVVATAGRAIGLLAEAGIEMRHTSSAEIAAVIADVAGLSPFGPMGLVPWTERWSSFQVGRVVHRSFGVQRWGRRDTGPPVNALDRLGNAPARSVSTAVTVTGSPDDPGICATVRICADNQVNLEMATRQLLQAADRERLKLLSSNGFQHGAFVAGLPLGGPEAGL